MPRVLSIKFALALVCVVSLGTSRSEAGPTKYDPKTKSFRITYTFAALPSFGMPPEQIEQVGTIQTANAEQETKVRAIYQSVSKILEDVTAGRARIGSLDYVDNVKQADVIISLTGTFDRAGWAVSGGIEGRPGQIGLYYQYLEPKALQDVANTVGHELCHYLFALPDEYSQRPVAECPLQNPESPGCLMDNYFVRHGYRRLCSAADHNADGPRNNPGTIVQGHKAEDSCQLWVDNFFKTHPPDPNVDSSATGPAGVEVGSGSLDKLINSATLKVREDALGIIDDLKQKKKPSAALNAGKLASFAKKFLDDQIKQLVGDPAFLEPNSNQVKQAVDRVVQNVTSGIKQDRPTRFNETIIAKLKAKASELANALPTNERDLVQALLGDKTTKTKTDMKRLVGNVARDLLKFAATQGMKSLIGLAPPTPQQAAEEKLFIEQIAQEAVAGPGGSSEFATYYKAAQIHIELSMDIARTVNSLASELDVPGSGSRRLDLKTIQDKLNALKLPGKTSQGFGRRRTYIASPLPLKPQYDLMRIDAGDNLPYREIRDLAAGQLKRLIRRERVEIAEIPSVTKEGMIGLDHAKRFSDHVDLVKLLIEHVRRDRAENIVFIAPPGGISNTLDDVLEDFRKIVLENSDVRVDLILFGEDSTVPLRLRDLVVQTGGSVQTAVDLDEIGAVAQRIETEIAAGSWVTTPQRGYILLSSLPSAEAAAAALKKPQAGLSIQELLKKYTEDIPDDMDWNKSKERAPLLSKSINEIDRFTKRLTLFTKTFVNNDNLAPAYGSVTSTISGLYQLRSTLDSMRKSLKILLNGPINAKANVKLGDLFAKVYDTKQSLRPLFGSIRNFDTPLTSTDDYMDWTLRKLLVQEAKYLNQLYLSQHGTISPYLRNRLTIDTVNLWQRSSIKSQNLADISGLFFGALTTNMNDSSILPKIGDVEGISESLIEKTLREESRLAPGASSLLLNAVDLLQKMIEVIQLEHQVTPSTIYPEREMEVSSKDDKENHSFLDLTGGTLEPNEIKEKLTKRYDARTKSLIRLWNVDRSPNGELVPTDLRSKLMNERILLHDQYLKYLELFFLDLSARFLERASALPMDFNRFSPYVAKLVNQYDQLKMGPNEVADLAAKLNFKKPVLTKRMAKLEKSVKLLEERKEHRLGSAVDPFNQMGAMSYLSSLEADETKRDENGLTPIIEALKTSEDLDETMLTLITPMDKDRTPGNPSGKPNDDQFKVYFERTTKQLDSLGLDLFSRYNDILEQARQIAYAEFPRLVLDTLGRLREFEDDLRFLRQTLSNDKFFSPVFERVERAQSIAESAIEVAKDGHITKIDFEPFQVEGQAEFEIIIGLSRPLRWFTDMEANPPTLRLYKHEANDPDKNVINPKNLIDQPYLRFDADISTENMLVFRVPRPTLRAGFLGAGKYYVRLLIDKKHMPILSRDNTVNYTFSVATPSPNVQLIAALRQTQPKDGDIDLTKDKEYAFRGTVAANLSEVVVEVEVLAGAPVINSNVIGRYQMIRNDNNTIALPSVRFVDDGLYPDSKKDDGIYTARITLSPSALRTPTEYRLYIEAKSNDKNVYIPLSESIPINAKPDPTAPQNQAAPTVPTYQRSTSLNFHVSAEN